MTSRQKFISREPGGGLSFTVETWQQPESQRDRADPVQTRKNNSHIPVAQWPESKQAEPGEMRDGEEGRRREITYLHR